MQQVEEGCLYQMVLGSYGRPLNSKTTWSGLGLVGHLAGGGGVNGGVEAGDMGYVCIHSFIHSRNVKGSQSFRAHSFMQQVMAEHLLFAQHVLEARVL